LSWMYAETTCKRLLHLTTTCKRLLQRHAKGYCIWRLLHLTTNAIAFCRKRLLLSLVLSGLKPPLWWPISFSSQSSFLLLSRRDVCLAEGIIYPPPEEESERTLNKRGRSRLNPDLDSAPLIPQSPQEKIWEKIRTHFIECSFGSEGGTLVFFPFNYRGTCAVGTKLPVRAVVYLGLEDLNIEELTIPAAYRAMSRSKRMAKSMYLMMRAVFWHENTFAGAGKRLTNLSCPWKMGTPNPNYDPQPSPVVTRYVIETKAEQNKKEHGLSLQFHVWYHCTLQSSQLTLATCNRNTIQICSRSTGELLPYLNQSMSWHNRNQ
jgi:hypothetical protein